MVSLSLINLLHFFDRSIVRFVGLFVFVSKVVVLSLFLESVWSVEWFSQEALGV